jgi:four helix bundle protein
MAKELKNLEIYKSSVEIGNLIWNLVSRWKEFEKKSIGIQLVKAIDSVGANLAEGFGRYHYKEKKMFSYLARGSLEEAIHWSRIATMRGIIGDEDAERVKSFFSELSPKLNAYISQLGKIKPES